MWKVYLLQCSDDTLYCGTTTNIDRRVAVHNAGKGAKYTTRRLPVYAIWAIDCPNRSVACRLEHKIKKLSRKQKEKLVRGELCLDLHT